MNTVRRAHASSFSLSMPSAAVVVSAFMCVWASSWVVIPNILPLPGALGMLAFFLYICHELLRGKIQRVTTTELLFGLFWLWSATSMWWSIDLKASKGLVFQYASCLIMFSVVSRVSVNPKHWRKIGWSFIFGILVTALVFLLTARQAADNGRFGVEDINANYIAYSVASAFPVLFVLLATKKRDLPWRAFACIWMVVCFLALLYTGSRGAMISVFLTGIAMIFPQRRRQIGRLILLLITVGISFFIAALFLPDAITSRFGFLSVLAGKSVKSVDLSYRLDNWPFALQMFYSNIVRGIGVGAFESVSPLNLRVHNIPLSLLVELGLIGFILYFLIVYKIFVIVIRRAKDPFVRRGGIALLAAWIPIAMSGAWEVSIVAWLVFAWFLGGAAHPACSRNTA